MHSLDCETSPVQGDLSNGYALEPWRVRQRKAFISSIACVSDDGFEINIERPNKPRLISLMEQLDGKEVYCHNGIFDVAWIIASVEDDRTKSVPSFIRRIKWRDTMLLCKWIVNGQTAEDMRFSYSLRNLVGQFLKDAPGTAEYLQMKDNVTLDPNNPYWSKRGILDAIKTLELAKFLETKLKPEQRRGFIIEQRNISYMANSWLMGVRVDMPAFEEAERFYLQEQKEQLQATGLNISIEALSSPTQLSRILYSDLGMPVIAKTPSGNPSTSEDTLLLLAYQMNDKRLNSLVKAKKATTVLSKYIKTAKAALERTGDGYMYGVPKIFGANTGRFTMSNETLKEQKVSIAMHQIPRRDKKIRAYMRPPEGMLLSENDAMAQEFRIMAIWSRDENMIRIINNNIDPHAWMAEQIYGTPWEKINIGRKSGDKEAEEIRQNGKLLNLSSNFRIGGKAFARKSFTEYEKWMSEQDGYDMQRIFKRAYTGVPKYWDAIISFAKANGYTYTLAQRRFKIHKWDGRDAWKSEGIAISMPIQGTAGEHLHGGMTSVHDHALMTTLHDAMFFAVHSEEEAIEINSKLNSVKFDELWNVELPVALPFEHKIGQSFADVK